MARYARSEGILIEAMGHLWAAFCPATGETTLLNTESVSILEVLEAGAADEATICDLLAEDCGVDAATIAAQIEGCWPSLIEVGLVREMRAARTMPG